jgi:hypothetical protein
VDESDAREGRATHVSGLVSPHIFLFFSLPMLMCRCCSLTRRVFFLISFSFFCRNLLYLSVCVKKEKHFSVTRLGERSSFFDIFARGLPRLT